MTYGGFDLGAAAPAPPKLCKWRYINPRLLLFCNIVTDLGYVRDVWNAAHLGSSRRLDGVHAAMSSPGSWSCCCRSGGGGGSGSGGRGSSGRIVSSVDRPNSNNIRAAGAMINHPYISKETGRFISVAARGLAFGLQVDLCDAVDNASPATQRALTTPGCWNKRPSATRLGSWQVGGPQAAVWKAVNTSILSRHF